MMSYEEEIAQAFHESYEKLASRYRYKTRNETAVPWEQVPENNKALMIAVVEELLDRGVIARPRFLNKRRESRTDENPHRPVLDALEVSRLLKGRNA